MQSEVELDDEVGNLGQVAAQPELYAELVRLGTVKSLAQLLAHENTDVVIDTARVLQELTDADAAEDAPEEALVLTSELLSELPS